MRQVITGLYFVVFYCTTDLLSFFSILALSYLPRPVRCRLSLTPRVHYTNIVMTHVGWKKMLRPAPASGYVVAIRTPVLHVKSLAWAHSPKPIFQCNLLSLVPVYFCPEVKLLPSNRSAQGTLLWRLNDCCCSNSCVYLYRRRKLHNSLQPPFFARPRHLVHTHFCSSPLLPSPPFLDEFQFLAGPNLYLLQRALWWNEGSDLCLALRVR